MNQELQQNVGDALNKTVHTASGLTAGAGLGTILEVIPPLMGCGSMLIGMIVTVYFALRKKRLYDKYEKEIDARDISRKSAGENI